MHNGIEIRQASFEDYVPLANFLSFEYFVHRHLDWRTSLDWLGKEPFLIAEYNQEIIACFAAPNDVASTTWVRVFACANSFPKDEIWDLFFEKALDIFDSKIKTVGALGILNWFVHMIAKTRFKLTQEIIVLERSDSSSVDDKIGNEYFIRKLDPDDLPYVVELDELSFPPLWQMPMETMRLAYLQSGYSTVIEKDQQIIGYQITTDALSSAHLARIAVRPDLQKRGLAGFLLTDVINYYQKIGISRLTVNTQNDNFASQMLYKKFGFERLNEHYPVYTFQIYE
ncbi:MAG: hypothetical protein CVU46_02870 [Chloroflexi bacterium HGW-Chloroflexi-8]|nr:MAG: hypothetical protein CVU46_02870 [Chloroflexi bacterium HGW-Chloroflexi-8]